MKRKLCLCIALGLVGCAGAATNDPPSTTAAVVAVGVEKPVETPRVAPKPPKTYTDDQILGMLSVYNKGEVQLATIAHQRSKDPRVIVFAKTLHDDHQAALSQETKLAEKLVLRPQTTDDMARIERATASEAARLASLSDKDFDTEFVTSQVHRERDTLAMLDVQLIPSAKVPDVRAHLADYRDRVDHHLRDAEELQRSVGGPILAQR